MISSTISNLEQHRKEARKACLKSGYYPLMQEDIPASPGNAVHESISMVDKSHVYIGIFGQKYGTIPEGYTASLTEIELNRAIENGIPCLIFIMDDEHPLLKSDIDCEHEEKLKRLIGNITNVYSRFDSAARLYGEVILALSHLKWEEERKVMDEEGT
jgi:hypothetical protein